MGERPRHARAMNFSAANPRQAHSGWRAWGAAVTALVVAAAIPFAACGGETVGLTSDPGRVSCGAITCPAGAGAGCCLPPGPGYRGVSIDAGTCVGSQHGCESPFGAFECDEAADCPAGNVCCYVWGSGAFIVHSRCVTSCPTVSGDLGDEVQACHTDAECTATGACKVRTCGVALATCESIAACP